MWMLDALNAPTVVRENAELVVFLGLLSYAILVVNWIVTTDWEAKFHWCSLLLCGLGILYLHYANVKLLYDYENAFVTLWLLFLWYHGSTWRNNYDRICNEIYGASVTASLRPYRNSLFRFLITMPNSKNASNQWNPPPFRNAIHVLLVSGYMLLLSLHVAPFLTPIQCLGDPSPLCCRYNYAMQGFDSQEVNENFCSGKVRVGTLKFPFCNQSSPSLTRHPSFCRILEHRKNNRNQCSAWSSLQNFPNGASSNNGQIRLP